MKTKLYLSVIGVTAVILVGCTIENHEHRHAAPAPVYAPPPPPVVIVPAPRPVPPPVVVVPPPPRHAPRVVYVPEYYVWDGYEYVGMSGQTYLYLTPHGWAVPDKVVLGRFHKWEKHNPHWRKEATRYHGHDPDRDHDRGRDHDSHHDGH